MKQPKHIAFIMDGNRRWARKNKFKTIIGHNKGVDRVEELVEYASEKGIEFVTFWAFSTENWNRSKAEVEDLMNVFRNLLNGKMIDRMMKNGIRVTTIGDVDAFPKDITKRLKEIVEESEANKKITVVFALNYGGRDEILRAVNSLLKQKIKNVNDEEFSKFLFTKDMPDPDLIVRTGGETRLSGYLPWQSTYSELFFVDTLWPDFTSREFQEVLEDYSQRDRRFGK